MALGQALVNWLLLGSFYAAVALGFSLVWGVLNIINMLHGAFVVLGAYFVMYATQYLGGTPILWTAAACVIMFAAGYLTAKPLADRIFDRVWPLPGKLVKSLDRFQASATPAKSDDQLF